MAQLQCRGQSEDEKDIDKKTAFIMTCFEVRRRLSDCTQDVVELSDNL